ncbi:GntR family transcriptional regulator [Streptomyces pactum]|uniref:GntR family transcriptional regulator n=1 Tax=Streptomyces pactum TaxID=68249 RepID=UPI000B1BDA8F|nr:GntR family transcriptional regulator [Streptomyces pactum]
MTVDLDGPDPLYEQIAAVLTARIADGTYPPRRRIPSEAAVVEEFGVSRPTARAAVQLLSTAGSSTPSEVRAPTSLTSRPEHDSL